MRKRIAIYGGSFDPIHIGHAALANIITQLDGIDGLWLMVSPANPIKEGERGASPEDRLEMVRSVAAELPGVEASAFELEMPLPSYTINTLDTLRDQYPDIDFTLVVGADNLNVFDRWRDGERIIQEYGLIVYPRPGYDTGSDFDTNKVRVLKDVPTFDISSTYIRDMITAGHNVTYLVTPEVARYIKDNNLYQTSLATH